MKELNRNQLANLIGVSKQTLSIWNKRGKLNAWLDDNYPGWQFRKKGNQHFYRLPDDVDVDVDVDRLIETPKQPGDYVDLGGCDRPIKVGGRRGQRGNVNNTQNLERLLEKIVDRVDRLEGRLESRVEKTGGGAAMLQYLPYIVQALPYLEKLLNRRQSEQVNIAQEIRESILEGVDLAKSLEESKGSGGLPPELIGMLASIITGGISKVQQAKSAQTAQSQQPQSDQQPKAETGGGPTLEEMLGYDPEKP